MQDNLAYLILTLKYLLASAKSCRQGIGVSIFLLKQFVQTLVDIVLEMHLSSCFVSSQIKVVEYLCTFPINVWHSLQL